ncbi:hypothetical protein B0H17DRAFT_194528 [Mycena rosella]|uniref:Reverse transcriptase zinc-binding domain-containing protein n=1 Tax=Mycena rosella TaxID=1033263 RepID=A0AAD7G6M2_MYCRO|nr:hypothetical protein B0H17DRAFT_194528 [Mycena rosella]
MPSHILRSPYDSDLSRSAISVVFQLQTDFSALNARRFALRQTESPRCSACGAASETRAHFLLHCSAWDGYRAPFRLLPMQPALDPSMSHHSSPTPNFSDLYHRHQTFQLLNLIVRPLASIPLGLGPFYSLPFPLLHLYITTTRTLDTSSWHSPPPPPASPHTLSFPTTFIFFSFSLPRSHQKKRKTKNPNSVHYIQPPLLIIGTAT